MSEAYEFDVMTRYPVAPVRLSAARALVVTACEMEPGSIRDGRMLATKLQGVADAVTDIILAKGVVAAGLASELAIASDATAPIVLQRHYDDPEPQHGNLFVAYLDNGYGVVLGAKRTTTGTPDPVYDVDVPAGWLLRSLLDRQEHEWGDMTKARDFRDSQPGTSLAAAPDVSYPFSYHFGSQEAVSKYMEIFRLAGRRLLEVTAD